MMARRLISVILTTILVLPSLYVPPFSMGAGARSHTSTSPDPFGWGTDKVSYSSTCTAGCTGSWPHVFTITHYDQASGAFSGTGVGLRDSVTEAINGTVTPSGNLTLHSVYGGGGYSYGVTATRASDGSFSGTAISNQDQHFTVTLSPSKRSTDSSATPTKRTDCDWIKDCGFSQGNINHNPYWKPAGSYNECPPERCIIDGSAHVLVFQPLPSPADHRVDQAFPTGLSAAQGVYTSVWVYSDGPCWAYMLYTDGPFLLDRPSEREGCGSMGGMWQRISGSTTGSQVYRGFIFAAARSGHVYVTYPCAGPGTTVSASCPAPPGCSTSTTSCPFTPPPSTPDPGGLSPTQAPCSNSHVCMTVTIPGNANIFGAGHASLPAAGGGGGTAPPTVTFPAHADQVLTFTSVTGQVKCTTASQASGPEGPCKPSPNRTTDINSVGGIAGIVDSQSTMFLVGVFLDDSEPHDPAPPRLDFSSNTLGHEFTKLAPVLNQVFYIGDGKTSTGKTQRFAVPAKATRLVLGFADAFAFHGDEGWYGDDSGSLTALLSVEASPASPSLAPPSCPASATPRYSHKWYMPADFMSAYDVHGDARGETIGIILGGLKMSDSDLCAFAVATGTPFLREVPVRTRGPDTVEWRYVQDRDSKGFIPHTGADDGTLNELAMDVEYAHAMAPHSHIIVWLVPIGRKSHEPDPGAFTTALKEAVDSGVAIVSNSWLEPDESNYPNLDQFYLLHQYYQTIRTLLHEAAHDRRRPRSFFFASGDYGPFSGCKLPAAATSGDLKYCPPPPGKKDGHVPVAAFPASTADVVAVGGTGMDRDNGDNGGYIYQEYAWGQKVLDPESSGGGYSPSVPQPPFQGFLTATNYRGVPDVAAYADTKQLPAYVYYSGHAAKGGGTSLATPLWAGMAADLDRYLKGHGDHAGIGFITPVLYSLYAEVDFGEGNGGLHDRDFHDITDYGPLENYNSAGTNYLGVNIGWDSVTGLGSPDLARIESDWIATNGGTKPFHTRVARNG